MRRSMRLCAALCGAVALFAACGGSSSKATPSSSGATTVAGATDSSSAPPTTASSGGGSTSGSDDACKLVTQSEATALFGSPAIPKIDAAPSQLAKSVCLWSAKPTTLLSYLLQVRIWKGAQFFTGGLPGYSPLAGVADRAAIYVLPGGSTIMTSYQKGDTVVSMSYGVHEITSGNGKKAEDQKDQFIALVKQAAGR